MTANNTECKIGHRPVEPIGFLLCALTMVGWREGEGVGVERGGGASTWRSDFYSPFKVRHIPAQVYVHQNVA